MLERASCTTASLINISCGLGGGGGGHISHHVDCIWSGGLRESIDSAPNTHLKPFRLGNELLSTAPA